MKIFPYIYEPEKSIEVFNKTNNFLDTNKDVKSKIEELGWVCHEVGNIIPQTIENYWSGHSFPFSESLEITVKVYQHFSSKVYHFQGSVIAM
jgi:hypothetical protein